MSEKLGLEDGLNDVAIIRTTFEVLDLFPPDDPIQAELQTTLTEARDNLVLRLQTLHNRVQTEPKVFGVEWEKFRTHALKMMTQGYLRRNLDSMMKFDLFVEGESSLYYLEAAGLLDLEKARRMPAHHFAAMLINEVLQSAQNPAYYVNKLALDQNVFQKYVALMFLCYAVQDPIFYSV